MLFSIRQRELSEDIQFIPTLMRHYEVPVKIMSDRQAGWHAAKIHELIKLFLPLDYGSHRNESLINSLSPLSLIAVFICFGNNKTHYTDHCWRFTYIHINTHSHTHTMTFAVAVSGASSRWQGKRSERPLLNTWMHSHNGGWNPVICLSEIKKKN